MWQYFLASCRSYAIRRRYFTSSPNEFEYVLISHRSKESNPSDKMQTFSNRQMETFLVEAGFQPLSYGGDGTQVLFYAVNTKFTKEQATKRWIARSGFELPTKKQLLRRWLGKLRII